VQVQQLSEIKGYKGKLVPHSFSRQPGRASHLGIIFPGMGYTTQMPLLYYAPRVLLTEGADVMAVEQEYAREQGFLESSRKEQRAWVGADAVAAWKTVTSQQEYERMTLIGKSLGTWAMADLLEIDPPAGRAEAIWLTPLLGENWVRQSIVQWGKRSLFVIGTADPRYEPSVLEELRRSTGGEVLAVKDADHSMEIPGQVMESIQVLERVIKAVMEFLGK